MKNTTLYTTSCYSTTTGNCEDVLDRHQEWLIYCTLWIWNEVVNSIHKFHDLVSPLAVRIFKSLQSRTLNDWAAFETILFKVLSYFHLYKLDKLFIINHIALIQEYYDIRNVNLTGQKDMLLSLSHNTISSSYYEDSTIHLSSTSDHVLYIVSMAWAVNVCIMSLRCLILNVSSRDCDTTLSLFRSLINILKVLSLVTRNSSSKNLCDSSS